MAHKKLSKAAVLYFPASILNQAGSETGIGAKCSKCMMFLTDISSCTGVYHDDNEKNFKVSGEMGVCGWMGPGKPMTSKDHKSMPVLPRRYAGYLEEGPTYCGICKYYEGRRITGSSDLCSEVGLRLDPDGEVIEYGGCCDNYKKFVKTVRSGDNLSRNRQGLRGLARKST